MLLNQSILIDESTEAAVVAAARKELAYLKQLDQPLLPFCCERRAGYQYKKQSPSAHIKNLERYLLISSSVIPTPAALHSSSRPPAEQYHCLAVAQLWLAGYQPA
jgi:hypothetical protein